MPSLTVIITACNNPDALRYTYEGLVEQTIEEFEVLTVTNGCSEAARSVIDEYSEAYVGFSVLENEPGSIPAARNAGVKKAKDEYILFLDGGDYISPASIENILKTAEETKADIITVRYYISGENEPYYDRWMDMLATVPTIDRFDRALLNTLDCEGRVYKKKFFELYSLEFPDIPVMYNTAFLSKCMFSCGAAASGCAGAIYDRRTGVFSAGFPKNAEPSKAVFDAVVYVCDDILSDIKSIIEEETGALDGDEYTLQEFLSVYFGILTNRFYRYFWYLNDELLSALREKFEELSSGMLDERKKALNNDNADLRFPAMYITHKDACAMPMFSLLVDLNKPENLGLLISSLYIQRFPFFEIYIKESDFNSGFYPERWKNAANLHVLPDAGFFAAARNDCSGIAFPVKDDEPLDPRILSELSVAKVPKGMLQYLFSGKRKKYSAKTYLKHKGLSIG